VYSSGPPLALPGGPRIVAAGARPNRAAPVADVGLVPELEPPALHFLAAVGVDQVLRDLVAELFPFPVLRRRVRPAGVDVVVRIARLPEMAVWCARRRRRQRLRYESQLPERSHLACHVGAYDLVEDRPVVDRPAVGILRVDVCRTPFEGGLAVAGREQVVDAHEYRDWAEILKRRQQLLAIRRVRVVRLVV